MCPGCCETLNSRTKTKDKRANAKPRPIAITKTHKISKQARHRWSQNGQRKPCLEPFSCHRDRYVIFTASLFPLPSLQESFAKFSISISPTMCHSTTTSGCCPGSPRPHKKATLGLAISDPLCSFFPAMIFLRHKN